MMGAMPCGFIVSFDRHQMARLYQYNEYWRRVTVMFERTIVSNWTENDHFKLL
jgi:hypothetical protein